MNIPSLGGNWVDLVILLIFVYFLTEAWSLGFWVVMANFLSFLLSILIALRGYQFIATLLRSNFSLSHSFSNALGFLFIAILVGILLGFLFGKLITKVPMRLWKRWWLKTLSFVPALAESLIFISFVLILAIGLPFPPSIKADVTNSKIGGAIVRETAGVEAKLNEIFGGVVDDALTYLTIKTGSRDSIPITVSIQGLSVDEVAEVEMFRLVNSERRERELPEFTWREEVVPVARSHARDMWERSYFGHVSPEGEDVGDRLANEKASFLLAGENLALAPTLATAHNGLMNSPGHRAIILDDKFEQIGIGVIDNGVYGKMFVQIFTD
ncbi:MAG: CvpA family protein [Patescibacteria group bacterium]